MTIIFRVLKAGLAARRKDERRENLWKIEKANTFERGMGGGDKTILLWHRFMSQAGTNNDFEIYKHDRFSQVRVYIGNKLNIAPFRPKFSGFFPHISPSRSRSLSLSLFFLSPSHSLAHTHTRTLSLICSFARSLVRSLSFHEFNYVRTLHYIYTQGYAFHKSYSTITVI